MNLHFFAKEKKQCFSFEVQIDNGGNWKFFCASINNINIKELPLHPKIEIILLRLRLKF